MVTATVFATWFGSETVLGIPATFLKEGLHGVVADPFGSSHVPDPGRPVLRAPLYRMNLLTIGDFYRKRFGRTVEVLTTLCIVHFLPGLGGGADHGARAWCSTWSPTARCRSTPACGRLRHHPDLHHLRRHVVGGDHRLHPDDHHRHRHAVHRLSRSAAWSAASAPWSAMPSAAGKFELLARARAEGDPRLHRRLDHHDVRLDPAAGRVPARASSKNEKIAVWGSVLGGALYFCSPSCRCSSPIRRR